MIDDRLLHHSPDWWSAVGTLVNAAIVVVLAGFNLLYLWIANRQAKAAEKQTEEIKDQIALSREQLDVMQRALHLSVAQDRIARRNAIITAESELRKIEAALKKLLGLLGQPAPSFQDVSEDLIFPIAWTQIARCIEQEIDNGDHWARVLQSSLLASKDAFHDLKERRRSAMPNDAARPLREAVSRQVDSSLELLKKVIDALQTVLNSLRPDQVTATAADSQESASSG